MYMIIIMWRIEKNIPCHRTFPIQNTMYMYPVYMLKKKEEAFFGTCMICITH